MYTKLWSPGADLIRHKYRARPRCEKVARVFRLGFGARHERRRCSLYHIGCGDNNTLRVQSRPLTSTHHSRAWVVGWVTTPQANPGSGAISSLAMALAKRFMILAMRLPIIRTEEARRKVTRCGKFSSGDENGSDSVKYWEIIADRLHAES